ncbi:TIGR04282 family arsenosugar biosynthesis glycosyltransferase [bacterium]|nr:TIGR04282 family arsenosugar biosynthesis glycosyltransferase [bacterium]
MNISQTSLFVFVKKPVSGAVKTRLGKTIGDENAARLYRAMAETSIKRFQAIPNTNCTVYFDPPEEAQFFSGWFGASVEYLPQCGGDLGERLKHGFLSLLQETSQAIALGSDSPDLPIDYLKQILESLQNHDVAIGPSTDGGYYCIGLKKFIPEIFDNIDWSTEWVFEQTLQRCNPLGLSVFVGPEWSDIDVAEDLTRLKKSEDQDIQVLIQRHAEIFQQI